MNTEAVMCIAFTRQIPSLTPLLATRPSMVEVMFTKPRRSGTSNHKCSVSDFLNSREIYRNFIQGNLKGDALYPRTFRGGSAAKNLRAPPPFEQQLRSDTF